jgi:hypothetical protein
MKASPLLDADSFSEVTTNMLFGVLVGGGVGGIIEGIGTRALLNKLVLNKDVDTKFAEMATYMERIGANAYGAGDKAALLVNSLDQLPVTSTDPIIGAKARKTYEAGITNTRLILNSMIDKGDEALTNTMLDTLLKMRSSGMPKEEMYDYLARLGKVSRVGTKPSVPIGDIFYVNTSMDPTKPLTDFNQLISSKAEPDAISRAYRLRPFATAPRIIKNTDTVELDSGITFQPYTSAAEAWKAGADIYVGPGPRGRMTAYVNPQSPNIEKAAKPGESRALTLKEEKIYRATGKLPETSKQGFFGAPIVLNARSGAITETAIPVVGDLSQNISIDNIGLRVGDKSFPQSLE